MNENKFSSPLEALTDEDRDIFDRYCRSWAGRHTSGNPAPIEDRLAFWDEAKGQYLFKAFGGKLILEKPVDYARDNETLGQELERRVSNDYDASNFFSRLYFTLCDRGGMLDRNRDNPDWEVPEEQQAYRRLFACGAISYITSIETLIGNRWNLKTVRFPLGNDKYLTVTPGTKITRILGKLANAYNIPGWEGIRRAHADVCTYKNTSSNLYLSIHPMDYVTMSDNNENWESCMAWTTEDGEDDDYGGSYRAGTVEMMNSPMVVVAYIKSDEPFEGWNSKVWRNLFIIHKDVITGIKGYPQSNHMLDAYVVDWLRDLVSQNLGWEYKPTMYTLGSEKYYDDMNPKINFYSECMYNDTYRVDMLAYVGTHVNATERGERWNGINYSGTLNCMWCGKSSNVVDFDGTSHVCCLSCNPFHHLYCSYCEDWVDEEDSYEVDGEILCPTCYDEHVIVPDDEMLLGSEEPHLETNCTRVYLTNVPEQYLNGNDMPKVFVTLYNLDNLDLFCTDPEQMRSERYRSYEYHNVIDWRFAKEEMIERCGINECWDLNVPVAADVLSDEEDALEEAVEDAASQVEQDYSGLDTAEDVEAAVARLHDLQEQVHEALLAQLNAEEEQNYDYFRELAYNHIKEQYLRMA